MQSTVEPASTRICGWWPGTGTGTAIAGRATPLMRPMRSSAAAIVAPVFPALTIASALPSRTSCAQTRIDASFFARTTVAGSSISTTSDAPTTSTPGCPLPRSGVTVSSRPTSRTRAPTCSAASRAPSTIAPGALSPPIASMATVTLMTRFPAPPELSLDVDHLTAAVPSAVAADDVRLLHRAAVGAQRPGRSRESPVRRAALARLAPRGLALGDGHRIATSLVFRARARRARPSVDRWAGRRARGRSRRR